MVRLVESVRGMPTPNSMIAFSTEAPLLAAGSIPGTGNIQLRVLRTSPGLGREDLMYLPAVEFAAPEAAFCRVCWSKPTGCSAGLIAGGLESGEVAVWNPAKLLSTMTTLNLEEQSFVRNIQEENWLWDVDLDYWASDKRRKSRASPPLLNDRTGNTVAAETAPFDMKRPVARFSKHLGSVHGLEFSSQWPNLIASGAKNGRIMVWDLADPSAESVPTWQTESTDGDAITCISWSAPVPNVLGATSFQGLNIWDTRSKSSHVACVQFFPRRTSSILFNPLDKNSLMVSFEDYLDTASVEGWDLRSLTKPVTEMCQNSKGVIAMSMSPHDNGALLVSTKNDNLILLNLRKQKVIWTKNSMSGRYYDVQWSGSNRGVFAAASHNNLDLFKMNDSALPLI